MSRDRRGEANGEGLERESMLPYTEIIDNADRRWTFRLLERLRSSSLPGDELEKLIEALAWLSDPRSFTPLEEILTNLRQPAAIRKAAGAILRGLKYTALDVPEKTLRHWWEEGDLILRRHALLCMGHCCRDIILQVASNSQHELQAPALYRMEFFFDRPEHQDVKIAALAHPDPKVRETGAYVLLMDEPIKAERPLMALTSDAVPEVAAEACHTLRYYPSLRTLRCLHGRLNHPVETVRKEAVESFEDIRQTILHKLRSRQPHVVRCLQKWLQPLWDVLAFSDEELTPDNEDRPSLTRERIEYRIPSTELLSLLADPDVSPKALQGRLASIHWGGYDAGDRRQLRPALLRHKDQLVRAEAARCLAAWQDEEGLVTLLQDKNFGVRKTAMYYLSQLPPTSRVVELAWQHLGRTDTLGVHATETLGTFVHHAEPVLAVSRLANIASDIGQRESLRTAAVEHLVNLDAVAEIKGLVTVLTEPPTVTWALHIALLGAIREMDLPRPEIEHLRPVDNLHMQEAIAQFDEGTPNDV